MYPECPPRLFRHYGLVLKDSSIYDPLVLVCPLKTNKRGAHPASDIDLGYVEGLKSDHQTLAVINQTRTLDKLRIFSKQAICEDNDETTILKLSKEKTEIVLKAFYNYVFTDYLK